MKAAFGVVSGNSGTGRALAVLVLLMIGGMLLSIVLSAVLAITIGLDEVSTIRCSVVLQNVLAFIAPALLMPLVVYGKDYLLFSFGRNTDLSSYVWIALIYAVATPAINYLVAWNESLVLPEWMSPIEEWMKNSEASAKVVTDTLMADLSVTGLMMNIFCMGILTGIGEELFFRGALQSVLARSFRNRHLAVWVAAVVFSAFHLQFYGFVPRMIMGAIFGYALLLTGSVWVPVVAHALNNISVVVLTYLINADAVDESAASLGVTDGFPLLALVSAFFSFALMLVFNRLMKSRKYDGN